MGILAGELIEVPALRLCEAFFARMTPSQARLSPLILSRIRQQ